MTFKIKIPDSEWVKWELGDKIPEPHLSIAINCRESGILVGSSRDFGWLKHNGGSYLKAYCILEIE